MRLMVNMSREQLEQLPEWQDTTEQAAADQTTAATTGQAPAAGAADPNAPAARTWPQTDPAAAPAAGTAPAAGQPAGTAASAGPAYTTATQDLSADDLMGSAVYSQAEESLGDVGDVIFDQAARSRPWSSMSAVSSASARSRSRCSTDAVNVQQGTAGMCA
jgi:hypothetical protein